MQANSRLSFPADLSQLSDIVDNDAVIKTVFDKLVIKFTALILK